MQSVYHYLLAAVCAFIALVCVGLALFVFVDPDDGAQEEDKDQWHTARLSMWILAGVFAMLTVICLWRAKQKCAISGDEIHDMDCQHVELLLSDCNLTDADREKVTQRWGQCQAERINNEYLAKAREWLGDEVTTCDEAMTKLQNANTNASTTYSLEELGALVESWCNSRFDRSEGVDRSGFRDQIQKIVRDLREK